MGTRVVDRTDNWAERSFSGGYRGLQELANQAFSGVVRADDAELYVTKGVAVGLRRGEMAAFEDADGVAHEAPSPALPLLAVMQERDLEVRDQFYSEQTPLSAVDETLSEGGFTGYIELSENVLSGDYYVVYHHGRSMAVGFVGESSRLVDGDEAFETADDEVGIYTVRAADIEHIELPEPADEPPADENPEPTGSDPPKGETTTTAPPADPESEAPPTEDDPAAKQESPEAETDPLEPASDDGASAPDSAVATDSEQHDGEQAPRPSAVDAGSDEAETPDDADAELEPQAIPSLDPARTTPTEETDGDSQPAGVGPTADGRVVDASNATSGNTAPRGGQVAELEAMLGDREEELERLRDELAAATDQRDALRDELETVTNERDDLRSEVTRLEAELAETESTTSDASQTISATEALTGTDIFVRYYSKGNPTLEDARGGSASRDDVGENLRLEVHTRFERDDVAVDGDSYDAFLTESLEHQFVEWVTHDLLFEIRETSNQQALADLYDVIPNLDHAELNGRVGVDENSEQFDIVFRDRTDSPLLVANLNDSREAATESMLETVVTKAQQVGQSADAFSGAFLVTRSFFDASAVELAGETTKSGLLSRDKRKSFVKLSRKRGYHLCLVEARDENFHLAVPDL